MKQYLKPLFLVFDCENDIILSSGESTGGTEHDSKNNDVIGKDQKW